MASSNLPAKIGSASTLGTMLANNMKAMQSILPKHITPERMARLVLLAATKTPALYNCTSASVLQAVMQAATLGLEINGALGSAYLSPYGDQATLIPGYRGLCDLARRTGVVRNVEARLVFAGDTFNVQYGTDPKIEHLPAFSSEERKPSDVIAVYAVATDMDGNKQFEVMTSDEVEAIRLRSRAKDTGPWKTDLGEMQKKTVVRRLMKYLPLSAEVAAAIELGDRADTGKINSPSDLIDTPASVVEDMTRASKDKLRALRTSAHGTGDPDLDAEIERQAIMDGEEAK